jgi:hypothetical protein
MPLASFPGGSWTRHGAIITTSGSGWRASAVWHSSIVKKGATYYLFFNAGGADGIERIGYATASSLTGPWTVDDVNSPLIQPDATPWKNGPITGDPSVYQPGGPGTDWYMGYFGCRTGGTRSSDGVMSTSDASFPLGWTPLNSNKPIIFPSESYDYSAAAKPFILLTDGSGGNPYHAHFYTAEVSGARQCAMAISALELPNRLTSANDHSNAAWEKSAIGTITVGAYTGADGASFDKIPPSTGNSAHRIGQSMSHPVQVTMEHQVDLKAAGCTDARVAIMNSVAFPGGGAFFDVSLTDGSITTDVTTFGAYANASASVESLGSGVYRCTLRATIDASSTSNAVLGILNAPDSETFAGNSANGIYVGNSKYRVVANDLG